MGAWEHGSVGDRGARSSHAPMPPCSRARSRGFTLTEILVALAILLIGMVGVMAAFASAVGLHRRGLDQTTAALLAGTVLEVTQAAALAGESCDQMSTLEDGQYVFRPSKMYPGYECRVVCTELNEREVKMVVDVRLRPLSARRGTPGDTGPETDTAWFETILLRP